MVAETSKPDKVTDAMLEKIFEMMQERESLNQLVRMLDTDPAHV